MLGDTGGGVTLDIFIATHEFSSIIQAVKIKGAVAEWLSRKTRNLVPSGAQVRILPASTFLLGVHNGTALFVQSGVDGGGYLHVTQEHAKRLVLMSCGPDIEAGSSSSLHLMPPRPFPFPLRVGTDICSIARIHKLLSPKPLSPVNSPLRQFLPKLLTWPEQQYFWHRFKDVNNAEYELNKVSQFLAGRWAAKEACRKGCEHLGSSNGFHSIMILPVSTSLTIPPGATSRPQALILRDRLPDLPIAAPDERAVNTISRTVNFDMETVEGQMCEVSISHDTQWATAVALVPVIQW
ncbi:hypothetical protein N0V90_009510 [Kalmusia sp. IMI 367209]|nr:hypothetical protein N0V90_009510 [Kalmusia sp. IMI 367209]